MKKLLLLSTIALLATSCRKEYTCTCTENSGGGIFTGTSKAKSTKKAAKEWCDGLQAAILSDGTSSGAEGWVCTVK
jgi:hypothetical protein